MKTTEPYTSDGTLIKSPNGFVAFAVINGDAAWLLEKLNQPDPGADLKKMAASLRQQENLVNYYKPKYEALKRELRGTKSMQEKLDDAKVEVKELKAKMNALSEALRPFTVHDHPHDEDYYR